MMSSEMAVLLLYQTNPVRVEFLAYLNTWFCCNKFAGLLAT